MAKYQYKAINQQGKIVHGHIEAANESDLEFRISNMSLDLIRFKGESVKKTWFSLQAKKVNRKELVAFTYHLEQLLKAGVPVIDALQDIRDSVSHGLLRDVISSLIENIGSGKTISEALRQHRNVFDSVFVSMVQVGEQSGHLVEVLRDLTNMIKWQDELIAKAKKMSIYPLFVVTVVIGVIAFLMMYLVPQLIPFLKMTGEAIPWHTQLLIFISDAAKENWLFFLMLPIIVFGAMKLMLKYSGRFQYTFDGWKLKLWIFGPILYKIKVARFSNYLAMMYTSGIAVLNAILMSKAVMNNAVLEDALQRAHDQISEGENISNAFANVGLFTALVVRMLRVGESTGAMAEALMNVSYFYSREVGESIEQIEPVIMPVITIFLAAIIAWIAFSVLGPIYDAVVVLSAF